MSLTPSGRVGKVIVMRTRRIVMAIYPGFQALDLAGPHEVFVGANAVTGSAAYRVDVVAPPLAPW
ncbi:MAG: hypothetical protein R2695_05440 [Acidimicrobiales bacterium]